MKRTKSSQMWPHVRMPSMHSPSILCANVTIHLRYKHRAKSAINMVNVMFFLAADMFIDLALCPFTYSNPHWLPVFINILYRLDTMNAMCTFYFICKPDNWCSAVVRALDINHTLICESSPLSFFIISIWIHVAAFVLSFNTIVFFFFIFFIH